MIRRSHKSRPLSIAGSPRSQSELQCVSDTTVVAYDSAVTEEPDSLPYIHRGGAIPSQTPRSVVDGIMPQAPANNGGRTDATMEECDIIANEDTEDRSKEGFKCSTCRVHFDSADECVAHAGWCSTRRFIRKGPGVAKSNEKAVATRSRLGHDPEGRLISSPTNPDANNADDEAMIADEDMNDSLFYRRTEIEGSTQGEPVDDVRIEDDEFSCNPHMLGFMRHLMSKYGTSKVGNYAATLFDGASSSSDTSPNCVSNSLLDDVRFTDLSFRHGFTARQSSDIIDFIKNAASDLNLLRHPKAVIAQCEQILGNCHEWKSKSLFFGKGETFGFEKDQWGVDIDYRPLSDVLSELLRESATKDNFNLRYIERADKIISQACHAKRFLRNERKLLGAKPGNREFVGQIIAFIDETYLDVCGRLKACPVIITLANFNSDVISGDGAKKVLLYVPLVDFTQAENKDKMRAQIREKIMDSCWEIILKQIIELQKEPLLVSMFGEKEPYVMKPVLYFIAQDTKEANTLCRHYQGYNVTRPCRICDVEFKKLLRFPFVGKFRTAQEEKVVRDCGIDGKLKARSMKGGVCPFFEYIDALGDTEGRGIYASCPPELLHQYEGGELKIAINAVLAQLMPRHLRRLDTRMKKLSRTSLLRLSRLSPFFKQFPDGFTNMTKLNSSDYPSLAFALVLLIGDSTDIFDKAKRSTIIKGLMAKLQVYCMLKAQAFSPVDVEKLKKALQKEAVSHKDAFRAFIKSKDKYPKRYVRLLRNFMCFTCSFRCSL